MLNKPFEKKQKVEIQWVTFECPEGLEKYIPPPEYFEQFKKHLSEAVQKHNDEQDGINN